METISNVASTAATTASKLLWGEQGTQDATTKNNETVGQEPISGQKGKGTVDDPYDQGNSEVATDPSKTTTTSDLPDRTLTSPTSIPSDNPINASTGGTSDPLKDTDKTGVITSRTGEPTTESSFSESSNPGAVPTSFTTPEANQQGTDKPSIAPKDDELQDPLKEAEELIKKRDPNDHSGEPMKVHDGPDKTNIPSTQEERRESKVGNPGGQEHGKEPKGTGEEWVKTTGLQAEGGDFDATKPGAGREAERILEEKGIKKSGSNHGAPVTEETSTTSGGSGSGEGKVSKMTKLKEKLHIGHKDKS